MSVNGFCANPRCKCDALCFESAIRQAKKDVIEEAQSQAEESEPEESRYIRNIYISIFILKLTSRF